MLLTVKPVIGEKFSLTIEPTATVANLKSAVEEAQGYPAGCLKLVHRGVELKNDADKLSAHGVVDGTSLILVTGKRGRADRVAPGDRRSRAQAAAPSPSPPPPVPAPAPAGAAVDTAASPRDPAAGARLTGSSEREGAVETLLHMGDWNRQRVVQALEATQWNPDQAYQVLLLDTPSATTASRQKLSPLRLALAERGPHFAEAVRPYLRSHPDKVQRFLDLVQVQDPDLSALLKAHSQEFASIITSEEPLLCLGDSAAQADPPPLPPPPAADAELGAEDMSAVGRLTELGVPHSVAKEIFLASGRSEAIAANRILDGV